MFQNHTPEVTRIAYRKDDVLLITGVPGWLGNRMLEILDKGDCFGNNAVNRKIRVLVEPRYKDKVSFPAQVEACYGDITDKQSLKDALQNVKTVYHLAGVVYPENIQDYYTINVEGTKNVVDACIELGVKRFLFMSSDSICGFVKSGKIFGDREPARPYKNYGRSKYLAEQYLFDKTSKGLIDGTSLRGFWFFGPGMPGRNTRFLKMFSWKRQIVFGNGKNVRSISHIDNIVQAFVKAEKEEATVGKWYWIGNENAGCSVDEIYSNIAEGLGKAYKPFYVPGLLCEVINLADSFIGLFGKINSFIHAAGKFHKNIAGDISAAQRDFKYDPQAGFKQIKREVKEIMLNTDQNKVSDRQLFASSKLQVFGRIND